MSQIHFNQPYLNFLISLADFSAAETILLLTGIIDINSLPASVREKVTVVSIKKEPIIATQHLSNFDLAIIIPNFGRVSKQDLKFPEDWEIRGAATGFIEDAWLAWGINATRRNGQVIAITSQGMLNSTLRQPTRQKVIEEGLESVILLGATYKPETSVNSAALVIRRGKISDELLLLDLSQAPGDADWITLGKSIQKSHPVDNSVSGVWSVKVIIEALTENTRLDPDFYHPKFLQIEPPRGYTEYLLSDIAEIRGGRSLSSLRDSAINQNESLIPFVQVNNITQDGNLSVDYARTYPKSLKTSSQSGWAQPNDILITVAGTLGKTCIISDDYTDGVFFDTSIRRIRISHEFVNNELVYEFLQSETAQLQIERYSSGSVIPIISTANLGSIRIFVPDFPENENVSPEERREDWTQETFSKVIARTLQEKVVAPLLNTDEDDYQNWREDTLEKLRGVMRQVQKDHEPLEDLVNRYYPLPIAIAYRRMIRAYHNPYEQVNRLVELYEVLTQFFYYVLLSDFLRSADLYGHLDNDKAIRKDVKAYKSFSMDSRLKFIRALLTKVKQEQLQLFVPELLTIDIFSPLNKLRLIRNASFHSAAGTAAAQKAIFEANWPPIEVLLNKLRFLRDYPLCRIDSFYTRSNKTVFRAEFFQGALYETDIREQEAPITENDQLKLIGADCDHVILLNSQFDWLDLHPFYQVIALAEFKYESHFCFHKQIQNERLHGESVQFRTEFELPGMDDLIQLTQSAGL